MTFDVDFNSRMPKTTEYAQIKIFWWCIFDILEIILGIFVDAYVFIKDSV